jgi:hypothetical protein
MGMRFTMLMILVMMAVVMRLGGGGHPPACTASRPVWRRSRRSPGGSGTRPCPCPSPVVHVHTHAYKAHDHTHTHAHHKGAGTALRVRRLGGVGGMMWARVWCSYTTSKRRLALSSLTSPCDMDPSFARDLRIHRSEPLNKPVVVMLRGG